MTGRKQFHVNAHYYLALLIAFCLPLARLVPIFIVLMLINWLFEGGLKNKMHTILKSKIALLFISFFMIHLLGLIYTENIDAGLFDVQVKLSLLIFPLLFVSKPLNAMRVNAVFVSFIAGGIVCSVIMLSRALYTYYALGENNFFYQAFSFLVHPSYLSMYFNLSISWILLNLFTRKSNHTFSKTISVLVILFFTFIIVLLSSKMGLLTLILIYFGFIIAFIVNRKKYLLGITSLVVMSVLVFSLIRFVPEIRDRFNNAVTAMSSSSEDQSQSESTAVRLLIWKAANQVISENFLFGAGTGDAKDALVKEYEKQGMTGALHHKLNAHNEFYQVFVSIGVIGFIVFLLCLVFPLSEALKASNMLYILFLLIMILNFVPESMFETQAGVMFYAFFNSLLCFSNNKSTNIYI
ncbi:MAG: O-antigen ligase family protein [Bacteroidetes bacterium]|nr:O-antigen ligase family protein [Bacteroidota bacterium]